jgi:uncharacterized circularly permuted ATP-grasp superfamily protein
MILNQGITFTVYGQSEGTERIFPYDLLPRTSSTLLVASGFSRTSGPGGSVRL